MTALMRYALVVLVCVGIRPLSVRAEPDTLEAPSLETPAAPLQVSPRAITPLAEGINGRISLDLRNIDVIDALKFLALKTSLNIIYTKSVTGRVTLIVENASVKDVFDIMLRSNNLAYDTQGDIYNVMTQDEFKILYGKNFADVRTVGVFRLKYAVPEHIFTLVDTLKSDIGRVLVDTESGSVMVLDSPERIAMIQEAIGKFEEASVIRVFKLNYARAKDVEEVLKTQLDSKRVGLIKADERNNQVVVQTLAERMNQIERLVAQLDQKTKEIIIETNIVRVKLSDDLSFGIEWEGIFDLGRKFGMAYLGSTPFAAVQAATDVWRSRQQVLSDVGYAGSYPFSGTAADYASSRSRMGLEEMHLGVIGKHDFDTVLKYLQTLGETRVLSNPKLAVVNNQEAKIHVGQRDAYVTTTTTTGQTTSTISEQVTFIDVGVLLSVVPNINDEGFVTLKVKAEINSVIDTLITPSKNQIPILDTSLAETTVMVKEGSTIIIGGLRKEENIQRTSQTPGLSKIPLLGNLFKSTSKTKERTELMIILTPRLITGEALVTGAGGVVGSDVVKPVKPYAVADKPTRVESLPSEVYVTLESQGLVPKGLK